ncbi:MAG: zinc-finger domain-containing protein [Rhodospirillaceae bacterium]|nr:MAG: zinc-finger domain-containing protein [Rhodospirillaceae bacterium]
MEDETIVVTTPSIACDGGDGAAGHPRVFLDVKKRGEIACPYCSRYFVLEKKNS